MDTATEVRERPILYSGEMVRAILDGHIVLLEGGCGARLPREESIARWIVDPAP